MTLRKQEYGPSRQARYRGFRILPNKNAFVYTKCVSCKRPSLHYFAERRWTHELKQKRHYKNNTVKWQRISDGNGKIIKKNI